jgi:hypothetical protein
MCSAAAFAAFAASIGLPSAAIAVPPPNDDYPGIEIPAPSNGQPFRDSQDVSEATLHASDDTICGSTFYDSTVWYRFTAPASGNVFIQASGYDAVIRIYPGAGPTPPNGGTCYDASTSTTEEAAAGVAAGVTYAIQVGSTGATCCALQLLLFYTEGTAPDLDVDRDGVSRPTDCNDADPAIAPGRSEIVNNSVDENCDGIREFDVDRDGYRAPGTDCNDNNKAVHPKVPEIPLNGLDDNCDGIPGRVASIAPRTPEAVLAFKGLDRRHITVTSLVVRNVPVGARVEVTCSRKGRAVCLRRVRSTSGKRSVGAARTFRFKALYGKRLRIGTLIEVRITKPKTVGKYIGYRISGGGFKKIERCLNPNSIEPRTKCLSAAF